MRAKTVSVNGTVYDTNTGQPLRLERSGHGAAKSAHDVHAHVQHSRTLNRRYIKRISLTSDDTPAVVTARRTHVIKPESTHTAVSRFALAKKPVSKTAPITPAPTAPHHPIVAKTTLRHSEIKKPAHAAPVSVTPSHVLKKQAIDEATSRMTPKTAKKPHKAVKRHTEKRSRASLAATALAFMLFSGYLTYLYMPNLSTRVAASQAGINAEYPAYHPSGYRLSGPVAYQPGEVSMKFAANAGPASYTLKQRRSAWDSTAVLENYVQPKAKGDYSTSQSNGLTIYSYGTNSAWVNGGVLYTIDGNAPLSNEQIKRIATSL